MKRGQTCGRAGIVLAALLACLALPARVGATTPTLTAIAFEPAISLGAANHDTATLAGGASPTGTITFRLYGPDDDTCASTPAFTSSPVPVSGNGDYDSPDFTPTAVGVYQWTASYSGDVNNDPVATACDNAGNEAFVVAAPDGSGTMTADTSAVANGSANHTIAFTYTAAAGGIFDGTVVLTVPPGWSPPSMDDSDPGYVTTNGGLGFPFVIDQSIFVGFLVMDAGDMFEIKYGDQSGTGGGATAPTTGGRQYWTTRQQSTCACTSRLLRLASSPAIRVLPPDGAGILAVKPFSVSASSRSTLSLGYKPGPGGIAGGALTVQVPSGWSTPSTNPSAAGYVTASAGSVSTAGQTITVSGLNLFGTGLRIKYGSRAGGGPGALVPASPASQSWTAKEKSSAGGTLTALGASPEVTVYAPDGSGTLTTPTGSVAHSSTGNTIAFTYTAAAGGISNGTVAFDVPGGWSAPSTDPSAAGYTTATTGTVSVSKRTIRVSGMTLPAGGTLTIVYGSKAGTGPGATAPSTPRSQTWRSRERSTGSGKTTPLAASPLITVI